MASRFLIEYQAVAFAEANTFNAYSSAITESSTLAPYQPLSFKSSVIRESARTLKGPIICLI